jgi:DNA mismatch repair protein MutS2
MKPIVTPKTRAHLEWHRVLTRLSQHCRGPVAAEQALHLEFAESRAALHARLDRVSEARALIDDDRVPPIAYAPAIIRPATIAARGGLLEPEDMVSIGTHLAVSARVRHALEDLDDLAPNLAEIARQLADLPDLGRELLDTFDERGDIVDSASGELRHLRTRVTNLHENLKQSVHGLLSDPEYDGLLQDEYYTIREDRYVLPIKSGHKRHVEGIVHGWSASGATVYIEPQKVVEANNRLLMAQAEVDKEIRRVLKRLSGQIGRHNTVIRASQNALGTLDLSFAGAWLSKEMDATEPVITEPGGDLRLKQGRHPLLLLQGIEVVPNDIELAGSQRALVVTGPNTGGKTVALKTTGLCTLMTLAGLHIPALEGSCVPAVPGVFTDIGDEQSLNDSRSTFSGHIANIMTILDAIEPGSLVLLDEIVIGTDPAQGAALAQAILECFATRQTMILVTTHYETLKALPFEDPRFRNGAVGFDAQRNAPTYALVLDVPGSSSALRTARRLGLDPTIVDRAAELADPHTRRLEGIIAKMEAEMAGALAERKALEKTRLALEVSRNTTEALEAKLRKRLKDGLAKERDLALREVRDLRTQLVQLKRDLRGPANRKEPAWIDSQKSQAEAVINNLVAAQRSELEAAAGPAINPDRLRVGQKVWVLSLVNEAELLSLPDARGRCEVRAGIMTARVNVDELRPARGKNAPVEALQARASRPRTPRKAPTELGWDALPGQSPDNTVDVRGQRGDEAIDNVERHLDTLYEKEAKVAFIIHGHGTGALKRQLRAWLPRCQYVADHRRGLPHEGGDGVTAVRLA